MSYVPAFSEIFVGFVLTMLWSVWLNRRGVYPQLTFWLPFVVGSALLAGQLAATYALVVAQSGGTADGRFVEWGRYGSAGVVIVAAVLEAALTVGARRAPPAAG